MHERETILVIAKSNTRNKTDSITTHGHAETYNKTKNKTMIKQ